MTADSRPIDSPVSGDTPALVGAEESSQEYIVLNRRRIIGVLGFALCLAAVFIIAEYCLMLGTSSSIAGALAFLAGIVIGCAVMHGFADYIQTHRTTFFVVSFALCVISVPAALFALPVVVTAVSACCCGVSCGFLYLFYGEYFSKYLTDHVHRCVAISFLVAGVLFLITVHLVTPLVAYFLLAVAFILFAVELFAFGFKDVAATPVKESREANHIVRKSYICTANASMMLGFCVTTIIYSSFSGLKILAALAVCVTCVLLAFEKAKNGLLNESIFMVLYLPICSVILVLQFIVPGDVSLILFVLMLCFTVITTASSVSAICKHISFCHLSGIHAFSFGRLASFAGILLGVALGVFSKSATIDILGVSPFMLCICVLLLITIFVSQFAMTKNYFPDSNPLASSKIMAAVEDEMSAEEAHEQPAQQVEPVSEPQLDDKAANRNSFHERCAYVANMYGLSARQSEIMCMLAKGRNGSYITKTLVISSHTAKAHIYNIYQKLGVHSRQELMDLVDNVILPQEIDAESGEQKH